MYFIDTCNDNVWVLGYDPKFCRDPFYRDGVGSSGFVCGLSVGLLGMMLTVVCDGSEVGNGFFNNAG